MPSVAGGGAASLYPLFSVRMLENRSRESTSYEIFIRGFHLCRAVYISSAVAVSPCRRITCRLPGPEQASSS